MRSIEDQMAEIRRRSLLYREKKQIRTLSLLTSGLGVLLVAVMMFAPEVSGTVEKSSSVLGSMILGPEAGGYVIVALLAFSLGIMVTIITQKYRKTDEMQNEMWKAGKESHETGVSQDRSTGR